VRQSGIAAANLQLSLPDALRAGIAGQERIGLDPTIAGIKLSHFDKNPH
jgi:hypothetical protein